MPRSPNSYPQLGVLSEDNHPLKRLNSRPSAAIAHPIGDGRLVEGRGLTFGATGAHG